MSTLCRHLNFIAISHALKILQNNSPGKVLTDMNGKNVVFSAIDGKDNGLNGTAGMSYTITGDGKFRSEYLLQM
jgi:hypothetical protein